MNEENLNIRLASVEDIAKIVSLVRTSFNDLYLTASIYKCFGIEKFICNEIENEYSPYKYFIAEIDNYIVGFVEFKMFYDSSVAFLNMIATDNTFKGKGVAGKFFKYTKEHFFDLGFKNIQLDVFSSNTVALNWYTSMGFEQEETKNFYKYSKTDLLNEQFGEGLVITNYSNFKCLYDHFGFSFLQLTFNKQNLNIGIINDNAILRDILPDSECYASIYTVLKQKNINSLYYIGKDDIRLHDGFTKIDEINRMKLIF